MADGIKVFENQEFGSVRTDVDEKGKVWFCGSDVAKALGYTNPRKALTDHCRSVTKRYAPHTQSPNKTIEMGFIPESDIYRLVFGSKLSNAERFTDWVTEEVLPDIRKHGMYMTNSIVESFMNDPRAMSQVFAAYADEREARIKLEQEKAELVEVNTVMKPKAEFADAIHATGDGIMVKQMAALLFQNGYPTGQNRLFSQLRSEGFLCDCSGERYNTPTQTSIERGIMKTRETHYMDIHGVSHISFLTLITPKGQRYFLQRYAGKILSDDEIAEMLKEEAI